MLSTAGKNIERNTQRCTEKGKYIPTKKNTRGCYMIKYGKYLYIFGQFGDSSKTRLDSK